MRDTQRLVPQVQVQVNGASLPSQAEADVVTVAVYQDIAAPSMFELRLINYDMSKLKFTWSDDKLFAEGSEVEILMGYMGKSTSVINGEITGLEPEFHADEVPTLTVRGYDRRHRLMRGRKTRSFTQMKDSEISAQIAEEAKLTPDAEDTRIILEYVLQHNQTDLEFLEARARRLGFEVVVEGEILKFRAHKNDGAKVLTLSRDNDVIEFRPRLSTTGLTGEVIVQGWSPKDKEAITGKASAGDEGTTMGGSKGGPKAADSAFGTASFPLVVQPVFSQADADQIALGRLKEMALSYVTGDGVSVGRAELKAGTVVKLEGFGNRFSGLYYLSSVCHTSTAKRGYRTAFTVRRNAT